jgi:hypothetical protein
MAARGEGAGGKGQEHQAEIDALFQAPLADFTAARNALAAKLKKDGDATDADRVKALGKPSISAWVANQLYWRHGKAFERLFAAGDQFRKAQAAQLAGKRADLRASLDARREALAELTKHAGDILREAGHPASPDAMRRIMTTLEALATYGEQPEAPQAGRLTADVDPPGFEALAALVPRGAHAARSPKSPDGKHAPPRVIPFNQPKPEPAKRKAGDEKEEARRRESERRAREAQARKDLRKAERALTSARRAAERARAAMRDAAARAKAADKAKAALESRFEKLSAAAEAARQDARRVASEAEEAAQAVDDAERAVQKARAAVDAEA